MTLYVACERDIYYSISGAPLHVGVLLSGLGVLSQLTGFSHGCFRRRRHFFVARVFGVARRRARTSSPFVLRFFQRFTDELLRDFNIRWLADDGNRLRVAVNLYGASRVPLHPFDVRALLADDHADVTSDWKGLFNVTFTTSLWRTRSSRWRGISLVFTTVFTTVIATVVPTTVAAVNLI